MVVVGPCGVTVIGCGNVTRGQREAQRHRDNKHLCLLGDL